MRAAASSSHVSAGLGHAEPAAGVAGLLALAAALEGRRAAPVLHLRSVNPLVAGIVSGRDGHAPPHAQMPRAEASAGSTGAQQHGESVLSVPMPFVPLCAMRSPHMKRNKNRGL